MKSIIKNYVKIFFYAMTKFLLRNHVGRYIIDVIINAARGNIFSLDYSNVKLRFSNPNSLCHWRYETFWTKEPETLNWIDEIPEGSIFWDIGANIGLYSIYAGKQRNCSVYAFEPSFFNLEILARNVSLNDLVDKVFIIPLALSNHKGLNKLKLTSTDWGGALSTFGENYGWDGKLIKEVFEFQLPGIEIDCLASSLNIPNPEYIKMDVDGIEHLILQGGQSILSKVVSVLIEVNDDFQEQAEQCYKILSNAGLILKEKKQSDIVAGSTSGFQNSFNQIWVRP